MSKASVMINDIVNPEYMMFHMGIVPPSEAKIVTAHNLSKITLISLSKITEYLAGFVEPENYLHHQTNTLLMNDGSVLDLDPDTIIVRVGYEHWSDRTFTFQLTTDSANLKLN